MEELKSIIKGCIKGKSKARELLYRKYSSKLFGVCLQYSRDYTEAEDTLQDGFIKIFNNIQSYKFKGSFEGWMRRIMVNTALEKYRKNRKLFAVEEINEPVEDLEELDSISISADVLLSMVQELPPRYRMVFNLYALDGYAHHEIAEMMEISVGTSKSNLARARQILKKRVEDYLNEQEQLNKLTVC
ncbi:MAG: RNA polymerase sigma factor [Marinifilaceae bacterium]